MKKSGFVSTALIYTFFILFLLLLIFLLRMYSRNRLINERYANDIKANFTELGGADINLYFKLGNKGDKYEDYRDVDKIDTVGYEYDNEGSYCKNNSKIEFTDEGRIRIRAKGKDDCVLYFTPQDADLTLTIFTKETSSSEPVEVNEVPSNYTEVSSNCENGGEVTVDGGKISVSTEKPDKCRITFTLN